MRSPEKNDILFWFFENKLAFLLILGFVLLLGASFETGKAATITVCPSGCDYTTVNDALQHPGLGTLGTDIVSLTSTYIFDPVLESVVLIVPDDVTISCEVGADTFGDSAEAARAFFTGSDFTVQDCTFENTNFDSSNASNISFFENTFSTNSLSQITLTNVDGFEISDNIDVQRLQIQTADNGNIDNNTFKCIFFNSCVNVTTAGGDPDYNDPADISNNISIINNTITNYITNTSGDWVLIHAGQNIDFTDNTIDSAVSIDDIFIPMMTIENGEVYVAHNLFLFPEKVGNTGGTWGLNLRVDEIEIDVLVQHNTFIWTDDQGLSDNSSCLGLFDDGTGNLQDVNISIDYNLCFNPSPNAGGSGIALGWSQASINLILTDSYNGIYNVSNLISDNTSTYTNLDSTTLISDPVFKIEDVDVNNDFELAPFSNYLDVDGAQDIGAFSGIREDIFYIDVAGPVDYTTIHATTTEPLISNLRTGDTVTFAAGVYDAMAIESNDYLTGDIVINGTGNSTIFEGDIGMSAIALTDISNSSINNIQVEDSVSSVVTTHTITRAQYTDGVTNYDDGIFLGAPDGVIIITSIPMGNSCDSLVYNMDGFDISSIDSIGNFNWNLFLVDFTGIKLTVFAPNNFITSGVDLQGCSNPGDITIEHFVEDIFIADAGELTYNASAATNAGVSPLPGETSPPVITQSVAVTEAAGVLLDDATGNDILNVTSVNNDIGVYFAGTSIDNVIEESVIENSNSYDIYSSSSENNTLLNSDFDVLLSDVTGVGDVFVQFAVRAFVESEDAIPLNGVNVEFLSDNGLVLDAQVTDGTGFTPFTELIGFVLSEGDISEMAGGYNPYQVSAFAVDGFRDASATESINMSDQTISVVMQEASSGSTTPIAFPKNISIFTKPEDCASEMNIEIQISGDNIKDFIIAHEPRFLNSQWQLFNAPQTHITWQLEEGDGPKTIYFRFRSQSNNVSAIYQDQIILDTADRCRESKIGEEGVTQEQIDDIGTFSELVKIRLTKDKIKISVGDIFKGSRDTVYYYGSDGSRHPFPDANTFFSWYSNFDVLKLVHDMALKLVPIGENVTFRPGSLVKLPTSDEVFLVTKQATLRHIRNEDVATSLFGNYWNKFVKDVQDVFFLDYTKGKDISSVQEYDIQETQVNTIDEDKGYMGKADALYVDPVTKTAKPKKEIKKSSCHLVSSITNNVNPGDISIHVRHVQELLQCLGYFPSDQESTAIFGNVTTQAVKDFQHAHNLPVTGQIDIQTREILNQYAI